MSEAQGKERKDSRVAAAAAAKRVSADQWPRWPKERERGAKKKLVSESVS